MALVAVAVAVAVTTPLLGVAPGGYQPESIETVRETAETYAVLPQALPPEGIRAPLAARTRAITHGPTPRNFPLPVGAPVFAEPPMPEAPAGPPAQSPAPSSSFLALGDDATMIPPDTQGAASPSYLMVAANSQVRIQGRDGSVLSTFTLNSFFTNQAGGSGVYDPVLLWDPYSSRWIMVACDDPAKSTSKILVSASASSDPGGSFNVLSIKSDATSTNWADRPHVGFNKDWIVVAVNMYTVSNSAWAGGKIYVFPKASLYAGGSVSYGYFATTGSDIGGSQVPARTLDSSASTMYLLQTWNNNNNGTATLALHTITGSVGNEILTTKVGFPSTTATWSDTSSGNIGPQSGTANKIDLGDDRILDLVYRNGSLWASHTVLLPTGGSPTRAAAQWWQLSTSGAVQQRGRVDDSSGVSSYAYPSLAVNKDNAMLLGFSSFSANLFAGASYALRTASDGAGTLQSTTLLKSGEAPYYKVYSGTSNRWGDYSATVVDPVNDTDFWTIQEYAAPLAGGGSNTARWSTWWGRVVPSGGSGSTCVADSQTLCMASGRFKVQAAYRDYGNNTGTGSVVKLTDVAGYFYFFDSSNPEVLAKFVSFCNGSSGNWTIYISGLTDVEVTFKVTDTKTGQYKEYKNALGNRFCTIGDGAYSCP